mmetsp:Transcript_1225/g.3340  ORF Transcript_1225/g.3340 Transcript_1225/m.3340 type:complete len:97 (+) Transcript_1225:2141-2431(+)
MANQLDTEVHQYRRATNDGEVLLRLYVLAVAFSSDFAFPAALSPSPARESSELSLPEAGLDRAAPASAISQNPLASCAHARGPPRPNGRAGMPCAE